MRVRNRSRKPTHGTADLPFQSKGRQGKLEPREKWSPLRLKMWRAQQRVAMRLRLQSRLIRSNIRNSAGWSPSPRVVAWALKAKSLGTRFQPASDGDRDVSPSMRDLDRVAWKEPSDTLRSSLLRRAVQVAREYAESVIGIPQRLWSMGTGNLCYLCSGTHSSLDCLTLMEREMEREASHRRIVEERLRIAADNHDFADDVMRLGAIHVRVDRIARSRARGLAYCAWQFAKHGLKATPLAPLRIAWASVQFGSDLWYVLTGQRYYLPGFRDIFDQLWESEVLLDFVQEEMARRSRFQRVVDSTPVQNEGPRTRPVLVPKLVTADGRSVMLRNVANNDFVMLCQLVQQCTELAASLDAMMARTRQPCLPDRPCKGYTSWNLERSARKWVCRYSTIEPANPHHGVRANNVEVLRNYEKTIGTLLTAFVGVPVVVTAEWYDWRYNVASDAGELYGEWVHGVASQHYVSRVHGDWVPGESQALLDSIASFEVGYVVTINS